LEEHNVAYPWAINGTAGFIRVDATFNGHIAFCINGQFLDNEIVYIAHKVFTRPKKCWNLERKKLWGNHFWARGYFADTVGVNEEIIRRYVRHQDKKDQEYEQQMELLQD